MLVLSRKVGESLVIGDDIRVTVVGIEGNRMRLGIEAPLDYRVLRSEVRPFEITVPLPESRPSHPLSQHVLAALGKAQ